MLFKVSGFVRKLKAYDESNNEELDLIMEKSLADEIRESGELYNSIRRAVKSNPTVRVKVGSVALSETIDMIREYNTEEARKVLFASLDSVMKELEVWHEKPSREALEVALMICDREKLLRDESEDCVIVAQALADPDSVALYSQDNDIIYSKVLGEIEEELRGEGKRNRKMDFRPVHSVDEK